MYNGNIKNNSINTISSIRKMSSNDSIDNKEKLDEKVQMESRKKKCDNCKKCFGFFDFLKTSWQIFKEFSADTSIHGIKYLTDRQRNWTEKLFWSIALILSILACSYCIYLSWRKRIDSPLIFSFAPKPKNIWEIPFSAITICPTWGKKTINEHFLNVSTSEFQSRLRNFSLTIDERITDVKWNQERYDSNKMFTVIGTNEGFCYTFNMMNFYDLFNQNVVFEGFENLKELKTDQTNLWDLQKGYYNNDESTYPFRVSGSGENGGLKFTIWRKIIEVKSISNPVKGFKLAMHLPCEIPQFDQQYYRFPLEKAATLVIRPSLTVTEGLDGYSTDARQCYLETDKKLKYFKKYTRANCLLECLVQYTQKICKCVHYSLPRMKGVKVCNSSMEECFLKAKKELARQKMMDSLSTNVGNDYKRNKFCQCLPSCTSLFYEGEISQDDIRYFSRSERNSEAYRSVVSIMFRDDDFLFTQRSEIHGWADFIANFGGLLGLFLGVSILSIVEIIYFISFRQLNEDSIAVSPSRSPENPSIEQRKSSISHSASFVSSSSTKTQNY